MSWIFNIFNLGVDTEKDTLRTGSVGQSDCLASHACVPGLSPADQEKSLFYPFQVNVQSR